MTTDADERIYSSVNPSHHVMNYHNVFPFREAFIRNVISDDMAMTFSYLFNGRFTKAFFFQVASYYFLDCYAMINIGRLPNKAIEYVI